MFFCNISSFQGEKIYNENRGLNPTRKDLENLLQKLNKTQGATKNDQKLLMALKEQLEAEGHYVYYQVYQSGKVCKFVLHEMILKHEYM